MGKVKGGLTFKIFLAIIMTDVVESVAEIFFKSGTNMVGMDHITFSNLSTFIPQVFTNYSVWIGIFLHVMNFLLWITILSKIDLSLAFPIGSTSYILVPLLSIIFLRENISLLRWAGIASIVAGIYFISKSAPKEADNP